MQDKQQQRQQKLAMIADWQQSGLSQKKYCEQNNIAYHVFHYWHIHSRYKADRGGSPAFVKLQTVSPPSGMHAELVLPDGKRLIFHQPLSADFFKALLA